MARNLPVSVLLLVVLCLASQQALAEIGQTTRGLILPGTSAQQEISDAEYVDLMKQHAQEESDANAFILPTQAAAGTSLFIAQDAGSPIQLISSQPAKTLAYSLTQDIRSTVEQAQLMASQLLQRHFGLGKQLQNPAVVIETDTSSSQATDGFQIDVTITSPSNAASIIPSLLSSFFPASSMPSMFSTGMQPAGSINSDSSSGSTGSSTNGMGLAADITRSVLESALTTAEGLQNAGSDTEVVLDVTVDQANPQDATQVVATAAAAAASAASVAMGKQPWDTIEVQMEVVESQPGFKTSTRFLALACVVIALQLLLCLVVGTVYSNAAQGDDMLDDVEVDLKQQKQQQGQWAVLAEEGKGVYQKLLSYA